jgi:hypothetical protein
VFAANVIDQRHGGPITTGSGVIRLIKAWKNASPCMK